MNQPGVSWPLLAALAEGEQERLLSIARRRQFARGVVLCHEGDPADSLHLVARGRLAVLVSTESGETAMLNVLGPGSYFGELALLSARRRRTATITALEDAETFVINAAAFERLRADAPAFERTLSALLGERVDLLSRRLLDSMYLSLDRRLHRRLLDLVEEYAESGATQEVRIPLNQSQLADLVGGTRPSVNLALQRLVDQGIVALARGSVTILDLARLLAKGSQAEHR